MRTATSLATCAKYLGVGLLAVLVQATVARAVYREVFLERRPTPGFLLNGSFEGRWIRDDCVAEHSRAEKIPSELQLQITEDVDLASWTTHPSMFSVGGGVFARGEIVLNGKTQPCEFRADSGEFRIHVRTADGDEDIRMWMWAVQNKFTPTPWRDLSSDELELTFLPNQVPIRFERAD